MAQTNSPKGAVYESLGQRPKTKVNSDSERQRRRIWGGGALQRYFILPLQGDENEGLPFFPGRCPGLVYVAPSGHMFHISTKISLTPMPVGVKLAFW